MTLNSSFIRRLKFCIVAYQYTEQLSVILKTIYHSRTEASTLIELTILNVLSAFFFRQEDILEV